MVKGLYVISLVALVSAGVVLVSCGMLWLRGTPAGKSHSDLSIVEKFQTLGDRATRNSGDVDSPLIQQATAYALYLNPPKPAAPQIPAGPRTNPQPAYVPPDTTAKFRLLATSCSRSSAEESWALVSEPGKGDHWVRKDERLGHFTVERVEHGSIFYRDGNQVRQMQVTGMGTVQVAQIQSKLSTSTQTVEPDLRSLNAPQPGIME